MPVPVLPVDLTVSAAPQGWGGYLPDFFNLVQQSLSAQLDPNFLIGQVGGTMPTHDLGPWYDPVSSEWWWFDPRSGQYQPGEQGTAVGTIALWGGVGVPKNWLLCDGREISRYTYSRLFQAVGETWGPGDGQSTFNVPPGGVIFFNATGFLALEQVALADVPTLPGQPQATANPSGVASRGGSQLNRLLIASDLPALQVTIKTLAGVFANGTTTTPGENISNVQPQGAGVITFFTYPVRDMNGKPVGKYSQAQNSILPPVCTINYMIKYQ